MKKYVILFLILCLMLSGCGGKKGGGNSSDTQPVETTVSQDALLPLEDVLVQPIETVTEILFGQSREAVLQVWGEPTGTLSGLYSDIYNVPDSSKYVIVRYDQDNKVSSIEVDSLYENFQVTNFSYADTQAAYQPGDPGVTSEGFRNTDASPVTSGWMALARAKAECTISYAQTVVAYDETADMWMVAFRAGDTRQEVYMDSQGITQLIIYFE